MYYVYFIKSITRNEIYIGSTSDLRRRIAQHNIGETISTKRYIPWKLVYYEAFLNKRDAKIREKKLKHHGKGISELKKRLIYSLNGAGFTIIELLISVAIISILLGVSFAGYARLNQRQTLLSSGQNLKNIIRDAQSRVTNNEIDCTLCDCLPSGSTSFNGWTVDFANKRIFGSCGVVPTIFSERPFNLSSDIIVTPHVTPASQLVFKNNPPGASGRAAVCLSHTNLSSVFYVIRVKETGVISDDGGLVSSCTP